MFFAHWLAHVPDDRFPAFWASVRHALRPGGVVEFVDVTEHERRLGTVDDTGPRVAVGRSLRDGRSFRIVKVFRGPKEPADKLADLDWTCQVEEIHHPGLVCGTCRFEGEER